VFWNASPGSGPLTNSAALENAGYTYGTYRPLNCGSDTVEISADARTVSTVMVGGTGCDAFRFVIGRTP
jgi:hypothetical protein